jgi:hypothetical protein
VKVAALACLASACWTSPERSVEPRRSQPPDRFAITLERTACHGRCPVYAVSIDEDGGVTYRGKLYVAITGEQHGRASRKQLARVVEAVERLRFFELDGFGRVPRTTTVRRDGGVYDFEDDVICSGMSSAIVTVTRRGATKKVSNSHCTELPIVELEDLIDAAAGTQRWIGKRGLIDL